MKVDSRQLGNSERDRVNFDEVDGTDGGGDCVDAHPRETEYIPLTH